METVVLSNKNQPLISEETSKRITSLRFLLIVLVVFIHNHFTLDTIAVAAKNTLLNENSIAYWIKLFIAQGLGRCAVPLFFVFSAFLQSVKNDSYFRLLKKKTKSLLLPYLIWTLMYAFYFTGIKLFVFKIAPQLIVNPDTLSFNWTIIEWCQKFFGISPKGNFVLPQFAGQFWFIRDLIILIIFSPILSFFVKKIPFLFLCVISILYFCSVYLHFVENQAIFYYSLGLFWGTYRINVFEKVDRINWLEIIVLFLGCFIISNLCNKYRNVFHSCYVFFDSIIMLKLSGILIKKDRLYSLLDYLSCYSFFLFAVHTPILSDRISRIWIYFFPMTNSFFSLFEFFGVATLIIVIGTMMGIFLKKICSPLFCLLNGGRR